jgi:hypothetical protein
MQNVGRDIARLITFLSRERGQVKPDNTVTLSVITGSSMLALSRLSDNAAASAVTRLVRLFERGPPPAARAPQIFEGDPVPQLTNKLKAERGQTMTEFALITPLLVVIVFAIIQFGIAFNNYLTLTDAARAAARKGAVSRNEGDPEGTCEAAGYAAGTNLQNPGTDFKLNCASSWSAGSDVTVTATYPYSIKLLDWVVYDGDLSTTMKERVE